MSPNDTTIRRLRSRLGSTAGQRAFFVTLAYMALAWQAVIARAQEPAYIALRSTVATSNNPILLGDVADVLTSDSHLKRQLVSVDVADAPVDGASVKITKKQIELRLKLAGYETNTFRVLGSSQAEVQSRAALSPVEQAAPAQLPLRGSSWDERILEQVVAKLSDLWQVPQEKISATLLKALPDSDIVDAASVDSIEVSISALQKPGNLRPRVSLLANGSLVEVWNISVEALVIHDVVVVTQPIERGQVVSSADVTIVQRPLRQSIQNATLDMTLGRTVRRALQPGHLVQSHDLVSQRLSSQSLIKARDPVRLVVRKGGLMVVVNDAEALQPGNPGDLIRVRNPRSKQVIVGRVAETGEVQVRL